MMHVPAFTPLTHHAWLLSLNSISILCFTALTAHVSNGQDTELLLLKIQFSKPNLEHTASTTSHGLPQCESVIIMCKMHL